MRSNVRVAVVVALALAFVGVVVKAEVLGKECYSNSDCPSGATCVAGDSVNSVQRCVAGTPCGGSVLGACPGDEKSGQLACLWMKDDRCAKNPAGCAKVGSDFGIYKCLSMSRCDQYFDNKCSGSCNVNGQQCNGRGTCQASGGSSFQCVCDSGWNGTRCDNVFEDKCMADVGQCGEHGTCKKNACVCKNGYTGLQCEIPPAGSFSGSGSKSASVTLTPAPAPSPSSTKATGKNESASPSNGGTGITSGKPKKKASSLVIVMSVIAALVVVGAIVFFVIARRRRQQQEAADANFNRSNSVAAEGEGRTGPPTPKQNIVIM